MVFNSAMEALGALVHAYYEERNMEAALSCVTDNIEWVGTEKNDSATGKEELRELLKADIESFPDAFQIELDEPKLQQIGSDGVMITVTGRQVEVPGIIGGFILRGTACCIKTEEGWLITNVHTSVPNAGVEKYHLERELDETRKKEKLLLSGIPGGVAIYRQKKKGLFCTEYVSDGLARMCGYPNGVDFCAYLQNNAMINVVEEDIPLVVNAVAESMEEKKTVSVMYRIHVKAASKAKTDFLSRVSHDMRTPLNGILGLTAFLKDSITDKGALHDLNELEMSGRYLLNLINDTLDVSRIENGKLELHPVVCDGKEVFENIVKLARPGAEAKHQKFLVDADKIHYSELYCDIGRVEQIVMNIVGNAVKFTAEGGIIECKLEQLEETETTILHRITVRDNGVGMSKEFLPVLFDAFSQADNTRKTQGRVPDLAWRLPGNWLT